jgi:hypothetical protein
MIQVTFSLTWALSHEFGPRADMSSAVTPSQCCPQVLSHNVALRLMNESDFLACKACVVFCYSDSSSLSKTNDQVQ